MIALMVAIFIVFQAVNDKIDGYRHYLLRGNPLLLCTMKTDI